MMGISGMDFRSPPGKYGWTSKKRSGTRSVSRRTASAGPGPIPDPGRSPSHPALFTTLMRITGISEYNLHTRQGIFERFFEQATEGPAESPHA